MNVSRDCFLVGRGVRMLRNHGACVSSKTTGKKKKPYRTAIYPKDKTLYSSKEKFGDSLMRCAK
ncbi:unnamed protein product [Ixodes persulcatus]